MALDDTPDDILRALTKRVDAIRPLDPVAMTPGALSAVLGEISAILTAVFRREGIVSTVVGGSALALHYPGVFTSNDLDVVLETTTGRTPSRETVATLLEQLGIKKESGRHWSIGSWLIEFPGGSIDEPVDEVDIGADIIRVLSAEAMLVQRLSSFRSTGDTGHAAQAISVLQTGGDSLDMSRLEPLARREDVVRHYNALRTLALGTPQVPLTDDLLRTLYWELHDQRVSPSDEVRTDSGIVRVELTRPLPPAITPVNLTVALGGSQ
jgi:hypothetical protein